MEEFLSKAPEELWTGIYTFLGAVLALLFGFFHAQTTKRDENVYRLLETWHAPEMLRARKGAVAILKEWDEKDERDIQKLRRELGDDESLDLSRVVHFLELVSALVVNSQVNRKLLKELLGDYLESYHKKLLRYYRFSVEHSEDQPWKALIKGMKGLEQSHMVLLE